MTGLKRFLCFFAVVILLHSSNTIASNSPYELSLFKETAFLGIGSALNITNYFIASYHTTLTQDEIHSMSRDDVNWFDRPATYNWSSRYDTMSDVTRDFAFIMPLSLLFSDFVRSDIATVSVMYIETYLIANGITGCIKSLTGRPRPFVYNERVNNELKLEKDAIRSFPSGHTNTAFFSAVFFATVFSDYYPNSKWKMPVWIGSLGLATATGYFRYKAGKHYPSDIIAGALIGASAGYGVPYMHRKKDKELVVTPITGNITGISTTFIF